MIRKIRKINENPIDAYNDLKFENSKKLKKKSEIQELMNILMSFGHMLSISFGEAGNNLIIKNLKGNDLNPIIKGEKVYAIFGFIYIRNFDGAIDLMKG